MTTILIADDESSIRTILKKAMERKNFTVLTASSGDEALQILQTESVDAAIVDIRMPEITGLELLDYLFQLFEGIFKFLFPQLFFCHGLPPLVFRLLPPAYCIAPVISSNSNGSTLAPFRRAPQ